MTDVLSRLSKSQISRRRRWGRFLARRDRCCHCTRRLTNGGTHAFGFWFCHRHFNAKTMGPWSDA